MSLSRDTQLSLEAIAYQKDTRLFNEMVLAIRSIRENKQRIVGNPKRDYNIFAESKIEERLFKLTGIKIKMQSGWYMGPNAYVIPPQLDVNHPLMDDVRRNFISNDDAVKRIRKAKGAVAGHIDLEKGRVSGIYSEIRSTVFVAGQLLQDKTFTVEESAAIFLHEIGHLMSYYEFLGRNVVLQHVMGDLVREFTDGVSMQHRVEILEATADTLELDAVDPDAVAKVKKTETVQTLILSEYANKWNSATKTHLYDQRTWEAMADQFVARVGAARHLATGLDKLMRIVGSDAYRSNLEFLVLETFRGLIMLPLAPLLAMVMALSEPWEVYDPPGERLQRIRRDLVNATKDSKIDKEYRRRLQDDIDEINRLLEGIKDRETFMMVIWKTVFPGIRKQVNRGKMIQELEALANNEMFAMANKLRTI